MRGQRNSKANNIYGAGDRNDNQLGRGNSYANSVAHNNRSINGSLLAPSPVKMGGNSFQGVRQSFPEIGNINKGKMERFLPPIQSSVEPYKMPIPHI